MLLLRGRGRGGGGNQEPVQRFDGPLPENSVALMTTFGKENFTAWKFHGLRLKNDSCLTCIAAQSS